MVWKSWQVVKSSLKIKVWNEKWAELRDWMSAVVTFWPLGMEAGWRLIGPSGGKTDSREGTARIGRWEYARTDWSNDYALTIRLVKYLEILIHTLARSHQLIQKGLGFIWVNCIQWLAHIFDQVFGTETCRMIWISIDCPIRHSIRNQLKLHSISYVPEQLLLGGFKALH